MKAQLKLPMVVFSLYGKQLEQSLTPASAWKSFTPYRVKANKECIFLKLIQMPASFHTSDQICTSVNEKFGDILHQVELTFIQRNFQSCVYLSRAKTNIFTIQSLITLKKQAGEKIQQRLILDFLEFVTKLEKHRFAKQLSFNLDQIGIDQNGKFILANYQLYFRSPNKTDTNLNYDARRVLQGLIMLSDENFNLMELYCRVKEQYGEDMLTLIERCMFNNFKTTEVITLLSSKKDYSDDDVSNGTLTDSYISDLDRLEQTLANNTESDGSFQSRPHKIQIIKSNKKVKVLSFIFFLVLLFATAALTYIYFERRPLNCGQSEFENQQDHRCSPCNQNCAHCQNGEMDGCISCKGSLNLVKPSVTSEIGQCSSECNGYFIAPKICIYSP